jgi:hypothetical protein
MNWNPFSGIAELESMHTKNIAVLSALTDRLNILNAENALHAKRLKNMSITIKEIDERLASLQNQFISRMDPTRPIAISRADVEKEAKRRLQRAAYARKYYAKKRADKAAAAAGEAK